MAEVLTLSEMAQFMRVSEAEVLHLVRIDGLPGRKLSVGWRFLKSAVQDWLCQSPSYLRPALADVKNGESSVKIEIPNSEPDPDEPPRRRLLADS